MPQMAGETIKMEMSSPRERVRQRISEQVPTGTVEVATLVPSERQQQTAGQIVQAPPFREGTVDAVMFASLP